MKKFLASVLYVEKRLREVGGEALLDRAHQCAAWANEVRSCADVLTEARYAEIDDALDEFLRMASAADTQLSGLVKVAFRKHGGKVHRGVLHEGCNRPAAVCGCPGAYNGSLTQGAEILAEGPNAWKISNCCPNDRPRKLRVLKPLVVVKAPKAKEAIVPAAAKNEMRWARQCRNAAQSWAAGEHKGTEAEIHRSVVHFESEAAKHEVNAAIIIRENEQAMSKRKEEAAYPKEAKLLIAKAKHAEANADEWRRLGRKDKVREETLAAEGFLAQAQRLIDDKAELKERLGNGTATGRERLDAMPKAKLLKVAKALQLRRANDSGDFSKMSAQGLRLALLPGRAYTANGGIDWASLLEAMDEVDGVASERRKAELAAEDKANKDFAEYAVEQGQRANSEGVGSFGYREGDYSITRMGNGRWYVFAQDGGDTGQDFRTLKEGRQWCREQAEKAEFVMADAVAGLLDAGFVEVVQARPLYRALPETSMNWGVYNSARKCFVYSCDSEAEATAEAARRNAHAAVELAQEDPRYGAYMKAVNALTDEVYGGMSGAEVARRSDDGTL